MDRITPEQALAAYAATGIEPGRTGEEWFSDDGRGCAAAALIRIREPAFCNPHWPFPMAAACLGVSRDYLRGFVLGFDGKPAEWLDGPTLGTDTLRPRRAGYADGHAAAEAVFGITEGETP